MNCDDARLLLQACADGELGAADSVRLERHLEDCADCVAALRDLQALRRTVRHGAIYHRAGSALRARVLAALPQTADDAAVTDTRAAGARAAGEVNGVDGADGTGRSAGTRPSAPARPAPAGGWRRWFEWSPAVNAAMTALTVAAVGLGLTTVALRPAPGDVTADAVVAGHVRALLSSREIDVVSMDRHTVKPWFNGRIDYAPDVRDLKAEGFPLVGGRLDYVDGRRVAVLVYRRGQHPLEVYVLPGSDAIGSGTRVVQGYNMESWRSGGMRYLAITDASAQDLQQFVTAWRAARE